MELPLLLLAGEPVMQDDHPAWFDVLAIYDVGDDYDDETRGLEMHVKLTHEGLIVDLVNEEGTIIDTRGWMAVELWDKLFNRRE